ncbi:MAG: hypothetical protein HUK22_08000, partial [Thermoguttaceae bacterium]|nr:hypothetical protein [Thermoguttaceae bacterium]
MTSRQKYLKKIYKKFKKRFPDEPTLLSRDRRILEHLVFAIFYENASFSRADSAFKAIEEYFIDWNEIRVAKAWEIADVILEVVPDFPEARTASERLRRLLQRIFEEIHKFDLEDLRTKGIDEFAFFLDKVNFATPFMRAYVARFVYGAPVFPLDELSATVMRPLDLIESDGKREIIPELFDSFDAEELTSFFFALHEVGAEYGVEATQNDIRAFIYSIDYLAAERSWESRLEERENYDPIYIAKSLAKVEKENRQKRPVSMDLGEESYDDDDSDGLDESNSSIESEDYLNGPYESLEGSGGDGFSGGAKRGYSEAEFSGEKTKMRDD